MSDQKWCSEWLTRGAILYDRKNLSSEGFFLFGRGHRDGVLDLRVGMVEVNALDEGAEKAFLLHEGALFQRLAQILDIPLDLSR